jgi:hypothetical protein
MSCVHKGESSACPFAFSDLSEQVQNYGCLPTPSEIVTMRVSHGKTWACHEAPDKPCAGAIKRLKSQGLPYAVIDPKLITDKDNWTLYVNAQIQN